jgi:quercetin 2,3-dioxygenase
VSIRPVKRIIESKPTLEGAGVKLRRAFGFGNTSDFDPFLLLDDFRNENPADYLAGFPWHPHRGIETITYVLAGSVSHGDSLGNSGALGAGDVQWMTAGSGILHQEMPKGDTQGRMHGFQLWANLPSSLKMTAPRYQDVPAAAIPDVTDDDGTRVRVVCGSFWGRTGPVDGVAADPRYLDVWVPAGRRKTLPVETTRNAFAYVFEGGGTFRDGSAPQGVLTEQLDPAATVAGTVRPGRRGDGAGGRCRDQVPAGLGPADPGAGGVVRPDRDEHPGGAAAGVRRAQRRDVHQARLSSAAAPVRRRTNEAPPGHRDQAGLRLSGRPTAGRRPGDPASGGPPRRGGRDRPRASRRLR